MRILLSAIILWAAGGLLPAPVFSQLFEPPVFRQAGDAPRCVCAADFDADGYLDLVVANRFSDDVFLYRNLGDMSFDVPAIIPVGGEPTNLLAIDLNLDGHMDLVVICMASDNLKVLINDGLGNLQLTDSCALGREPVRSAAGDFDGDGYIDVAVTNRYSNSIAVCSNLGNGTLDEAEYYAVGNQPIGICCADFDGDGDDDLAVVLIRGEAVVLLFNDGTGSFGNNAVYPVGDTPSEVHAVDLNNDGAVDIVASNANDSTLSVLMNNGNGTFQDAVSYYIGQRPQGLSSADFDRDGYNDIVSANTCSDSICVLLNSGDGTFDSVIFIGVGTYPSWPITADLDNDYDLDIVVTNVESDEIAILWNSGSASQLILPAQATYSPTDSTITQPVYAVCDDTLFAVATSFELPEWADTILDISTSGCPTADWQQISFPLADEGYIGHYVYVLPDDPSEILPPDSIHVFDIVLKPQEAYLDSLGFTCNATYTITLAALDTCMSGDGNYRLQFHTRDSEGDIVVLNPQLVAQPSELTSTEYMPGDLNCDGMVNVSDMTLLIGQLFGGAAFPCDAGYLAADVTGDALINIQDMTYLVGYLFLNGNTPKCYGSEVGMFAKLAGTAELHAEIIEGVTVLTLSSEIDLSGLEVHLQGNGLAEPVSVADGNLELLHGRADGLLKLGLLDLQGVKMIEAGETRIVEIPGEYAIVHALGSSVDHRPVGINLASSAAPVVPHSFALHQNYPNPFNPATTISFESPDAADYTLTVYNTLGQVVKSFEGTAQPGENEVVWDASASSSGVYFYKLEIGSFSDTKKMILLK